MGIESQQSGGATDGEQELTARQHSFRVRLGESSLGDPEFDEERALGRELVAEFESVQSEPAADDRQV